MVKEKVMEHLNGITEKFFKVIGLMALNLDLEFGNHPKVIIIKVNGSIIARQAKEHLDIKTVHIKDNS